MEARSVETILKQQLGNLLAEVAVLTSQVEHLTVENAKLKQEREAVGEEAKPAKKV